MQEIIVRRGERRESIFVVMEWTWGFKWEDGWSRFLGSCITPSGTNGIVTENLRLWDLHFSKHTHWRCSSQNVPLETNWLIFVLINHGNCSGNYTGLSQCLQISPLRKTLQQFANCCRKSQTVTSFWWNISSKWRHCLTFFLLKTLRMSVKRCLKSELLKWA